MLIRCNVYCSCIFSPFNKARLMKACYTSLSVWASLTCIGRGEVGNCLYKWVSRRGGTTTQGCDVATTCYAWRTQKQLAAVSIYSKKKRNNWKRLQNVETMRRSGATYPPNRGRDHSPHNKDGKWLSSLSYSTDYKVLLLAYIERSHHTWHSCVTKASVWRDFCLAC